MTRLLLGRTIHLAVANAFALGFIAGTVLALVTLFAVMATH